MKNIYTTFVAGALLFTASPALACPVCFSSQGESRLAFLMSTGFLTVLPLTMFVGIVWWLRKRVREMDAEAMNAQG